MKTIKMSLDQFRSAPDQRQYYKLISNENPPADFHGITRQDYVDVGKITSAYMKLFRDNNAEPAQRAIKAATHTVQMMIPNPEKALKSKQELKKALQETNAKLH